MSDMNAEMGVLTRLEVERLMTRVSRERSRVLKDFVEKVLRLDIGEELYQHYLSTLPKTPLLRELLNGLDPSKDYSISETINGYRVVRKR